MTTPDRLKAACRSCMQFIKETAFPRVKDLLRRFDKILKTPGSLMRISLILSAYNLIVFNIPFFKVLSECISSNLNGIWIFASMLIIMFVLDFLVYYLLLYLGRIVGKCIIAFTLIGNSICLYFLHTFNALIDRTMMGNVFGTQFSEASSFFSWTMIWYVLIFGVPICIWLFYRRINYGSILRFLANLGVSLVVIISVLFGNRSNVPWIDYHATLLGSKVMPWSYIVNSIRYYSYWKMINQKEIILPDAKIVTDSKDICVLIIGESARSENFSLYGYEKETNPLLAKDSVTVLDARASETYTRASVKAILSYKPEDTLYEILPNYLERNGVDVVWRTNNWGNPPIHVDKYYNKSSLKERFPEADDSYDGILFHGLKEDIMASDSAKIFIGIHTYTSHGPAYYKNVPDEHKTFLPECRTVEMADASRSQLINAYDNTIVYTDYLVHSVIETLKEFPDRRACVIFISDHGESLGEKGYYMHGMPKNMAPDCQLDIPFIVWTSDDSLKVKDIENAGHYNIYHTVLNFLGMETPIYNEDKDIFE